MNANKIKLIKNMHFAIDLPHLVYVMVIPIPDSQQNFILKWQEEPWPLWLIWLEHHFIHQQVVGSIPGQDTYPGCGKHPLSKMK